MKTLTCKVVVTFKSVGKIPKFKIWHFWESNGSDSGQEQ